jgi:hypothetical protein
VIPYSPLWSAARGPRYTATTASPAARRPQIGAGDVGCGDEKIRVVDTLLGAFLPSAIGAAKQIGAALEQV